MAQFLFSDWSKDLFAPGTDFQNVVLSSQGHSAFYADLPNGNTGIFGLNASGALVRVAEADGTTSPWEDVRRQPAINDSSSVAWIGRRPARDELHATTSALQQMPTVAASSSVISLGTGLALGNDNQLKWRERYTPGGTQAILAAPSDGSAGAHELANTGEFNARQFSDPYTSSDGHFTAWQSVSAINSKQSVIVYDGLAAQPLDLSPLGSLAATTVSAVNSSGYAAGSFTKTTGAQGIWYGGLNQRVEQIDAPGFTSFTAGQSHVQTAEIPA